MSLSHRAKIGEIKAIYVVFWLRRFYPLKFGAAGRPSLFFCRIKNAYCRASTIDVYIMLNLDSESLRLTARAQRSRHYIFLFTGILYRKPALYQKYRPILAHISNNVNYPNSKVQHGLIYVQLLNAACSGGRRIGAHNFVGSSYTNETRRSIYVPPPPSPRR